MANTLLHYTSFDSALQILLSGKVKFGNILNSNDQVEIEKLKYKQDTLNYYIFCGSQKNFNALMWFAYAKNKYGACIEFVLKKGIKKKLLIKVDNKNYKGKLFTRNINYIDYDNDEYKDIGFYKDKVFKDEQEFRYLFKSENENFFAEINWEIIESINLRVSNFFDIKLIDSIFKDRTPVPIVIKIEKRFNC